MSRGGFLGPVLEARKDDVDTLMMEVGCDELFNQGYFKDDCVLNRTESLGVSVGLTDLYGFRR